MVIDSEFRAEATSALLRNLVRDVKSLVWLDAELAKDELSEKSGLALSAATSLVLAAMLGLLALVCVTACLVSLLAPVIGFWPATLLLAVIYGGVAAVMVTGVRAKVRRADGLFLSRSARAFCGTPPPAGVSVSAQEADVVALRHRIDAEIAALDEKTDLIGPLRDTALSLGSLGAAFSAMMRSGRPQG